MDVDAKAEPSANQIDNVKSEMPENDDLKPKANNADSNRSAAVDVKNDDKIMSDSRNAAESLDAAAGVHSSAENEEKEMVEDVKMEEEDEVVNTSTATTVISSSELFSNPMYAELCSFFNIFSAPLGIKPLTFKRLEKILCTLHDDEVDQELIDLHITLLRKIYLKSARTDKWEEYLLKYCAFQPPLESEFKKLKRFGYTGITLPCKLAILRSLCDSQFDFNIKFRENIQNSYYTVDLRISPIGTDKNGNLYFYQQDAEMNVFVWSSEPDDEAGTSWQCRAQTSDELLSLVRSLKLENGDNTVNGKCDIKELNTPPDDDHAAVLKTKRCSLVCRFYPASMLNKKKQVREKRSKEGAVLASQSATTSPMKGAKSLYKDAPIEESNIASTENHTDSAEVDDAVVAAILDETRRILPTRNAKAHALANIRVPSSSPKKVQKNAGYRPETAGSFGEESDESEDDDDDEVGEGSTDDEFVLDDDDGGELRRSKLASKPYHRTERVKRKNNQKKKAQKGKKSRRGRKPSKASRGAIIMAKPPPIAAVIGGGTSDDDDDEEGLLGVDETQQLKEKKKATEKTLCRICNSCKRPDVLLLCDGCDDAWHIYCLRPQLWFVPDGDWFCPNCEHKLLIEKLTHAFHSLLHDVATHEEEDKRRAAAADRLKREMAFIGIDVGNTKKAAATSSSKYEIQSSSSTSLDEQSDEDDGQRRSKKKAIKKVMKNTRDQQKRELAQLCFPVVTVTEGRGRRNLTKVDYNFSSFDEQIKEAIDEVGSIESAPIFGAQKNRTHNNENNDEDDFDAKSESESRNSGRMLGPRPPSSNNKQRAGGNAKARTKQKLTDLNVGSDSDTDEYKGDEDEEEEPEPSEDEYLPSERARNPYGRGRRRSDDEFIDDDDSDADDEYRPSSKRGGGKFATTASKSSRSRKRRRYDSDENSSDDDDQSDYSTECKGRKGVMKKKPRKGAKNVSDSDNVTTEEEEDEDELGILEQGSDDDEDEDEKETTETGRPLRKAAKQVKDKLKFISANESDENGEDEDDESGAEPAADEKTVSGDENMGARNRRVLISEDEDDYKPESDEETKDDDDEMEEIDENTIAKVQNQTGKEPFAAETSQMATANDVKIFKSTSSEFSGKVKSEDKKLPKAEPVETVIISSPQQNVDEAREVKPELSVVVPPTVSQKTQGHSQQQQRKKKSTTTTNVVGDNNSGVTTPSTKAADAPPAHSVSAKNSHGSSRKSSTTPTHFVVDGSAAKHVSATTASSSSPMPEPNNNSANVALMKSKPVHSSAVAETSSFTTLQTSSATNSAMHYLTPFQLQQSPVAATTSQFYRPPLPQSALTSNYHHQIGPPPHLSGIVSVVSMMQQQQQPNNMPVVVSSNASAGGGQQQHFQLINSANNGGIYQTIGRHPYNMQPQQPPPGIVDQTQQMRQQQQPYPVDPNSFCSILGSALNPEDL